MDSKQVGEVSFWRRLHDTLGHDGFMAQRRADYHGRTGWFPGLTDETGRGIDYGCGLVSIFEFSPLDVDAYDPLLPEYREIVPDNISLTYVDEPRGPYDFVFCCNVIDHTPDPDALLADIERILLPGGRLYFEVNFDPDLFEECHWTRWDIAKVREAFSRWCLVAERVVGGSVSDQSCYEAVYTRP